MEMAVVWLLLPSATCHARVIQVRCAATVGILTSICTTPALFLFVAGLPARFLLLRKKLVVFCLRITRPSNPL